MGRGIYVCPKCESRTRPKKSKAEQPIDEFERIAREIEQEIKQKIRKIRNKKF